MTMFRCPRCGGPYFGVLLDKRRIECHSDANGVALSQWFIDFVAWAEGKGPKPKHQTPCGWNGQYRDDAPYWIEAP